MVSSALMAAGERHATLVAALLVHKWEMMAAVARAVVVAVVVAAVIMAAAAAEAAAAVAVAVTQAWNLAGGLRVVRQH